MYGIKENDDIIVPIVYSDVNGAIEEYEYFERLNTNDKQFLNRKLTNDKIDEIIIHLKNSYDRSNM